MTLPSRDMMAAIAVSRFGLGARPGEIAAATADPQGYLTAQIVASGADLPVQQQSTDVADRLQAVRDVGLARQAQKAQTPTAGVAPARGAAVAPVPAAKGAAGANPAQKMVRDDTVEDFLSRAQLGATTSNSFRERWALFWANHFTVSGTKQVTAALVGPFEREAIRPHVFGRFEDMLVASTMHPAMLTYLDQAQSIGPQSQQAQRGAGRGANPAANRQPGLNENLAREIMELHTLGVGAYTQNDVTEFARALTGWSYVALAGGGGGRAGAMTTGDVGDFIFRPLTHQPGTRTILGHAYSQAGMAQARAALHDFALNSNTATHLATKIARHFVADDPPPALVTRLAKTYTDTGGKLDEMAKTLIASDEAWSPDAAKFKTPYEFLISSYRAAGAQPQAIAGIAPTLTAMGQKPFSAPSPKGWDDIAATWAAPDAVIKRMVWSQTYAARVPAANPMAFANQALGARLTPAVASAISRAETRPEAVALLLMSPEFQRR